EPQVVGQPAAPSLTAPREAAALSLHDALPIYRHPPRPVLRRPLDAEAHGRAPSGEGDAVDEQAEPRAGEQRVQAQAPLDRAVDRDRKSTRLNSSHVKISYAVFCLKEKNAGARV